MFSQASLILSTRGRCTQPPWTDPPPPRQTHTPRRFFKISINCGKISLCLRVVVRVSFSKLIACNATNCREVLPSAFNTSKIFVTIFIFGIHYRLSYAGWSTHSPYFVVCVPSSGKTWIRHKSFMLKRVTNSSSKKFRIPCPMT